MRKTLKQNQIWVIANWSKKWVLQKIFNATWNYGTVFRN